MGAGALVCVRHMKEQDNPAVAAQTQELTSPCNASQPPRRLGWRTVWWVPVLLTLVGLVLFWSLPIHRVIPQVMISDIQSAMIKPALVRVAGKMIGAAHVVRTADKIHSLCFVLADGTGTLAVMAGEEQARQLALWDRVPRAGDAVEVTGRLRPGGATGIYLDIQPGAAFKLQRMERVLTPVAEIRGVEAGAHLTFTGVVARVIEPRAGSQVPYLVTLRVGTAEQQFVGSSNVMGAVLATAPLVPGAVVRVRVTVESHDGKLRCALEYPQDIAILAGPPAAVVTNGVPAARPPQ